MSEENMHDIVSSLVRLDASPGEVKGLIQQLWENLLEPTPEKDKNRLRERQELLEKVWNLSVIVEGENHRPFEKVVTDLLNATPSELLDSLTPDNIYETFPFRELGELPVAATASEAGRVNTTRVRELFRAIRFQSEGMRPSKGVAENNEGNTVFIEGSYGW